jgi:hypothetical protein
MNGAIAKNPNNYFSYLATPTIKRSRTTAYKSQALDVLKSYKYYGQISDEEFKTVKKEIKAAPHDDAISSIMTKLRKRVYG